MNARHLWASLVFAFACWIGSQASAQTAVVTSDVVAESPTWESVASRAETVLLRGVASNFALNRLRSELVMWRDKFSAERDQNSGRINTVDAQFAALGVVKEGAAVPESVAARREAIASLRAELAAPALLASEAFARATGLISEIDTAIRGKDAQSMTKRTASPLNPTYWSGAFAAIGHNVGVIKSETVAGVRADVASGALWQNLPPALGLGAVAVLLFSYGRRWARQLKLSVARGEGPKADVWALPTSFVQLAVPSIGLLVAFIAIQQLDVLGITGLDFLEAIINAGWIALLSYWLADQFFSTELAKNGPLQYPLDTRSRLRKLTIWLGFGLGFLAFIQVFVTNREESEAELAVLLLPVQIWLSIILYRIGQTFRTAPLVETADGSSGRTRKIVGLLCTSIAWIAPLLAAAGYAAAANALFTPAVLTLAILGVVVLLQNFVSDIWQLRSSSENGALAPILIGFALFVASLPIIALVWGARITDLLEIWERFRAGFSIGETTLSPTDFLTAVVVFALGFAMTRFIQGTLSRSILPRTRLDLGGQNAIVSGVGYVGIMLAVIAGIVTAGIDLSSLAIVAGALSVGIGFGLQNIVSNFVSGIILLIERPVSAGDMIEVSGQLGYVRKISVRSTTIETFDRRDVIVPNADLISGQVTNWTRDNSVGRLIVPVGVAYGSDVKQVTEILEEIAFAHPMVLLDPKPSVLFRTFGESSLDFEIRAILRDVSFVMSTHSEMNQQIAEKFAEADIEIPFPQRDLWLRNADKIGPFGG